MERVRDTYLDCWILDEVETDFTTIWELVSVFQQRQLTLTTSDVLMQIKERLNYLYSLELLSFYQGIIFNGDEIPVTVNITYDFIFEQSGDWKNPALKQIKMHITPLGRKTFLDNCSPEAFIF